MQASVGYQFRPLALLAARAMKDVVSHRAGWSLAKRWHDMRPSRRSWTFMALPPEKRVANHAVAETIEDQPLPVAGRILFVKVVVVGLALHVRIGVAVPSGAGRWFVPYNHFRYSVILLQRRYEGRNQPAPLI